MSFSYRDALTNGKKIDEPMIPNNKPSEDVFTTYFVKYDDSTYEIMTKCMRELEKKYKAKVFLSRENETLFCEANNKYNDVLIQRIKSIIPLKKPTDDTDVEIILSSLESTWWGIIRNEYVSTYNCSKNFAYEINTQKKIVRMYWDDGCEYVVFKSFLPPLIHDEIVRTFFTDVDKKFILNNYDKVTFSTNKKIKQEPIIDEDGFTSVTNPVTSKLSKKKISEMQLSELQDQLDIYARILEEKEREKKERAQLADAKYEEEKQKRIATTEAKPKKQSEDSDDDTETTSSSEESDDSDFEMV